MTIEKKTINITEIAKRANVSIATVSRVLNDPGKVKEVTRRRVQEEIDKVNYIRNTLGMQLRTDRTHTIGLIHTSLLMDFYSNIATGVEHAARNHNYNLILCNSEDDPKLEARQLEMLLEKRVDGIIISPTDKNIPLIHSINKNKIPVCCIDRYYPELDCDYVMVDNEASCYNATRLLIEKGYRNIGFLAIPMHIPTGKQRLQGYKRALADCGMTFNQKLVHHGEMSIESGRQGALDLVSNQELDCLFVSNELLAVGAYPALVENGFKIPEEIGFLMWDNPFWTQLCLHKISTISQPTVQIGTIAANTLIHRITHTVADSDEKPLCITLQTTMVDRETLPSRMPSLQKGK